MKKLEQLNKIIYTIIFTSLSILIFIVNINIQNMSFYQDYSKLYQFVLELQLSIKEFDIIYVTLGVFIFYFYYNTYFNGEKLSKKTFINIIISILLTFIIIIGKSYKADNTLGIIFNTPAQIIKVIFLSIGYFLVFYALLKKLSSIKIEFKTKKKNKYIDKLYNIIDKYQIIIGIIIIILCWLPYIINYYPGTSTGDTFDSLAQFFHQDDSWSIKTINLINEKVYINKHHPPLFTVIIGLIYKLGNFIASYTLGAFIYTILQIILLLTIFSFLIYYMKKIKVSLWIRNITILFFALTPIIVSFAITAVKDTPSSIFTMLYVIFLVQIVRNYNSIFKNKIRLIFLIITMLLVMMLRNNGIFTILLSFPFLICIYKKRWKRILLTLIITLSIFGIYDKVLLTKLDVTNGSIKEVLTIPFMQLSRVVYYNQEAVTEKDINTINKVLSYDSMKNYYDPNLADYVKDTYNKDTTKKELKDFFKVWFKYFKKYPIVYIESIINSTYGYFFPEVGDTYLYLAVDSRIGIDTFMNIESIEKHRGNEETIANLNILLAKLPFTSLFSHVAFYDWFLIFSCIYIIKSRKYKYLVPLTPLLSVLLVCLASPINGSFRYILPIVFSFPVIIVVDYLVNLELTKKNYHKM